MAGKWSTFMTAGRDGSAGVGQARMSLRPSNCTGLSAFFSEISGAALSGGASAISFAHSPSTTARSPSKLGDCNNAHQDQEGGCTQHRQIDCHRPSSAGPLPHDLAPFFRLFRGNLTVAAVGGKPIFGWQGKTEARSCRQRRPKRSASQSAFCCFASPAVPNGNGPESPVRP
jgi:hypothetical protein